MNYYKMQSKQPGHHVDYQLLNPESPTPFDFHKICLLLLCSFFHCRSNLQSPYELNHTINSLFFLAYFAHCVIFMAHP